MQPQQQNDKSFFDPKTLIAIAAVALVYFGWQTYLGKKYPNYNKPKTEVAQTTAATPSATSAAATINPVESKSGTVSAPVVIPEQKFTFSNDKVAFTLTNFGMGLKDFTVNNYEDKEKNKIKLGVSDQVALFSMKLTGTDKPLEFNVTEQAPGHYVGIAQVGEMTVKRELQFDAASSSFKNTISISKATDSIKNGFSLLIPEHIHEAKSSSFLFPSYSHQDFFVGHNGKNETVNFSGAKENFKKGFENSPLVSVGSQYFTAVVLDKSQITPEVNLVADVTNKSALAEVTYKPVQIAPEMTFSQIFYAGPKSIDVLKSVDPELAGVIDFGFFGMISRPLLYVMKAFHGFVGNWGFAIIMLTLLVRLCVLPFNLMSAKSMKAMQKVQPVIAALREKYKDDAMRLNTEMMAVMKQHGANPVGGCLPMLIQIPVFFALYRVIGSSVELYNSPFILWIHDLSAHDPFYVLPVLMAVFMFIQQKITPSTMDPTQAKIMLFLPLVFSVFMLQLPAGLTLYMVVSTLFGIIQQYFIMRDVKPVTKAVKA
ncbi:membrane protein insertase YidC [Bdellovibrio svalbardensis]|uniref:Membrane protein insertase YidC n=1 Tax=Bdellovibrio svalbardensis TaxID=2972972 RepID=A0ABT6DDL8_9BACT|nr:membrane protein insertase YidC [Bdellovibrio svalbardensis]MDG0814934.1 membrane protein insertase YidC [Bdellovibrio svalbardensis]